MGCLTVKDPKHIHIQCSNSDWWAYEFKVLFDEARALFHKNDQHIVQDSQLQAATITPGVTAEILNASTCRVHPNKADTKHHLSSEQNLAGVVMPDKATNSTMAKQEVVLHAQTEENPCPKVTSQTSSCVCSEKPMTAKMESKCYIKEYISPDDEDVCPTCLEEYDEENPKIVAKCSHHFHLGCIYEWMERSTECPICFKVMEFNETD